MKANRRRDSIQVWVFLFSLFLVLSACATFEIRDFNIEASPSTKIPLRVGLYMDSQFRNYRVGEYWLGEGMSRGARMVSWQAFQEVVEIDSLTSDDDISRSSIEAIAVPEIVDARQKGFSLYQITCRWTIFNTKRKLVYKNAFLGEGRDKSFVGKTRIEKAMTLAAKDSLQKFLTHVSSTKWWEAIRGTPNVDWPHPRKDQLPSPPIQQVEPVALSLYSQLHLPKYEISRQVPDPSPEMMALPGRWQGIWDMTGTPSALIIQKIEGRKVDLIYAWGFWGPMKEGQPGHIKITGDLTGPEPVIKFQHGDTKYTFTLEEGKLIGVQDQPNMPAESIAMVKVE